MSLFKDTVGESGDSVARLHDVEDGGKDIGQPEDAEDLFILGEQETLVMPEFFEKTDNSRPALCDPALL